MFETHRSAAFPLQTNPNIFIWNWIDLGVTAPYFMLEITAKSNNVDVVFHRMTASIKVLRNHVENKEIGKLCRVFLLSPSYVNGSDSFQMDSLESIYSQQIEQMNMLFKLTDGRKFYFGMDGAASDDNLYIVEIFKR